MVRILNTEISQKKAVHIGLSYVYGIGIPMGKYICSKLGFTLNMKVRDLAPYQITQITRLVEDEKILVGDPLRNQVRANIDRLKEMKCYRGIRHLMRLPVRGQRTKTNANSARRARYY
mmetsp:Transcript_2519/g.4440  ORF Transcript_2519/g.4440 Transcript_2519/m.4440 type:complete len:118 (-) Transcript_2519:681-1034(-)